MSEREGDLPGQEISPLSGASRRVPVFQRIRTIQEDEEYEVGDELE